MFTLYLGNDPAICLTENENIANKLAHVVKKFSTIKEAGDYSNKNDSDIDGYPYYSCWRFHGIIFVS